MNSKHQEQSESNIQNSQNNKKQADGYLQGLLHKINKYHQDIKKGEVDKLKQKQKQQLFPIEINIESEEQEKQTKDSDVNTRNRQQNNINKGKENKTASKQRNGIVISPSLIPVEYLNKLQRLIKIYNLMHENSKQEKDILTQIIQNHKSNNDTVSKFLQNKYSDEKNKEQFERDYQAIYKLVGLLEQKVIVLDRAYKKKRVNEVQINLVISKQKDEIKQLRDICAELLDMRINQLHPFQNFNQDETNQFQIYQNQHLNSVEKGTRSFSANSQLKLSSTAASNALRNYLKIDNSFENQNDQLQSDLGDRQNVSSNILSASQIQQQISTNNTNSNMLKEKEMIGRNNILIVDETLDELNSIQQDIKQSQNNILAQDSILEQNTILTQDANMHANYDSIINSLKICSHDLKEIRDSNQISTSVIKETLTDIFQDFLIELVNEFKNSKEQADIQENIIKQQKEQIENLQRKTVENIQRMQELKDEEYNQKIKEIIQEKEQDQQAKLKLEQKYLDDVQNSHNTQMKQLKQQSESKQERQAEMEQIVSEMEIKMSTIIFQLQQLQEQKEMLQQNYNVSQQNNQELQMALESVNNTLKNKEIEFQQQLLLKDVYIQDLTLQNANKSQLCVELEIQIKSQLDLNSNEKITLLEQSKQTQIQSNQQIQEMTLIFQEQIKQLEDTILQKDRHLKQQTQDNTKHVQVKQTQELINLQKHIIQKSEEVNKLKLQLQELKSTITNLEIDKSKLACNKQSDYLKQFKINQIYFNYQLLKILINRGFGKLKTADLTS